MSSPLVDLPPVVADTPLGQHPKEVRFALRVLIGALALVAVAGLFVVGSRDPKDPYLSGGKIPGFDEAMLKITPASGSTVPGSDDCVALAQTGVQIAKGLMTRSTTEPYKAMVFRFQNDTNELFYNRNVHFALSVSFYDKSGKWVALRELEPCPDMEGCPTIASPVVYRYVVETARGAQAAMGLGQGSTISITPGCGG